jgi:tetratricopeptide (TPR) repeat protein
MSVAAVAFMERTMSRSDRRAFGPLVAVLVSMLAAPCALPSQVRAQTVGDASELEVEARARFQLGQLYYSQARFAEAAHEFEEAFATHPHPLLLHNIYLARRDLGDIAGAVDALTRYLAIATDLSASDRRLLEGRLATMQRQLPVVTPEPEEPTEPTEPEDGGGVHDEAISTPAEATPAPAPTASGGIGIAPGAVVLGIGGAALVGAAIAGGVAMSVQSDRDAQCTLPGGNCPSTLDQNDYASRFATARDAGWGLLIVGAATAVVGAILLGIGASEHTDTPTVTAACDTTGCIGLVSGAL